MLLIPNTQSVDHCKSSTALAHYCSFLPGEAGKSFLQVKNLVTAQTQLHLYSEQQRALGISNVCYSVTGCSENNINLLFRLKRDRSSWIGPAKWPTDVCPFPQIKPYSPELIDEMWQCPIPPFPLYHSWPGDLRGYISNKNLDIRAVFSPNIMVPLSYSTSITVDVSKLITHYVWVSKQVIALWTVFRS